MRSVLDGNPSTTDHHSIRHRTAAGGESTTAAGSRATNTDENISYNDSSKHSSTGYPMSTTNHHANMNTTERKRKQHRKETLLKQMQRLFSSVKLSFNDFHRWLHLLQLQLSYSYQSHRWKNGWRTRLLRCYPITAVLLFHFLISSLDFAFQSYGFDEGTFYIQPNGVEINKDNYDDAIQNGIIPDGFAVVLNTYKRPDWLLRETVQHYASQCGMRYNVHHIYVIWSEIDRTIPPDPESFFFPPSSNLKGAKSNDSNRSPVTIVKVNTSSLNNRFVPIDGLDVACLFVVDDDVQVSCRSLHLGFRAWKAHPHSLVGYYPRLHVEKESTENIVYHSWPVAFMRDRFSIILTKASFLHARYFDLYHDVSKHPKQIFDYVDKHRNCEDIAMALLVANATKDRGTSAHPVYVEGQVSDRGLLNGISTGSGHFSTRSRCLVDLLNIYKNKGWGSPLVTVGLKDRSWVQHFPGYWWQTRPSNLFEWFPSADIFY